MDRHPYSPPQAEVRDPNASPTRPRSIDIALILLAMTIVALVFDAMEKVGLVNTGEISGLAYLSFLVKVIITIATCVGIARGKNWARYVLLLVVVPTFIDYVFGLKSLLSPLPEGVRWFYLRAELWRNIIPYALDFVVLYLLFFPGRSWFENRRMAG